MTWHSLEDVLGRASDDETDRLASLVRGRTDRHVDEECLVCGYVGKSVVALKRHVVAKERTGEVHR